MGGLLKGFGSQGIMQDRGNALLGQLNDARQAGDFTRAHDLQQQLTQHMGAMEQGKPFEMKDPVGPSKSLIELWQQSQAAQQAIMEALAAAKKR